MSIQLYLFRLKCLLRNKETMFWCYMFPILLSTCFFFAFNNLWKIEYFETLSIAYVSDGEADRGLEQALKLAKTSEEEQMFEIAYCDEEKAQTLLNNGDIKAYITGGTDPQLFVKGSGLDETIIKSFLDTYRQRAAMVSSILQNNPKAMEEGLMEDVMSFHTVIEKNEEVKKPAELLVYFYSLLAFTCIFAANWGLDEVVNIQADLSGRGARVNVSPIRKMKLFICNMLAAFTVHMGSILLLFFYMKYIIKINFGSNLLYLFLICLMGSFAGLGLGAFIGVWSKKKVAVKEAILSAVTLGGGFLSGMMSPDIKYMIATRFPVLGYINPVSLITDSMYSLYYYDNYNRFYTSFLLLGLMTVIFVVLAIGRIRRKSYASI
jgi:ABC-2 type transport system permease protein